LFKHILYFDSPEERDAAEGWIKANFEMEDSHSAYDDTIYCFYTSVQLTERQQQIIVDTVKPSSYMTNEEM